MSIEEQHAIIGRLVIDKTESERTVALLVSKVRSMSDDLTLSGRIASGILNGQSQSNEQEKVLATPTGEEVWKAISDLRQEKIRLQSLTAQLKALNL